MPTPPTYRKTNPADAPILMLALTSKTLPLPTVDDYAESIVAQKLSQVQGVGMVGIGGQQTPAMRVEVNPAQFSAFGLTLEDVQLALSTTTVDDPKGILEGPAQAYTLQTNDQLTATAGFNNAIIAYRNGAPIRISQIGHAAIGPTNDEMAAWYDNTPAIILSVQRLPNANVIQTVDLIRKELPQLVASMPPGVKLSIVSDAPRRSRLGERCAIHADPHHGPGGDEHPGVFAQCLGHDHPRRCRAAVHRRDVCAHVCVRLFPRQSLALMGLSIAVGFVVDDAIVMVENIVHHLETR